MVTFSEVKYFSGTALHNFKFVNCAVLTYKDYCSLQINSYQKSITVHGGLTCSHCKNGTKVR